VGLSEVLVDQTTALGTGVVDIFAVLEGSVFVPFLEVNCGLDRVLLADLLLFLQSYFVSDSIMDMLMHLPLYSLVYATVGVLCKTPKLVPLLCPLANQSVSLLELLKRQEGVANAFLQQVRKTAARGEIRSGGVFSCSAFYLFH
jgi:hypothetical protein